MKGILVNYEYCTGCHSCEVACKKEKKLAEGQFGIKMGELGPYAYDGDISNRDKWEWIFYPTITKACDMCADRVAKGKLAACVQTCQAWCIAYGEVEDLVKKIDGDGRYALLTQSADRL